MGSFRATFTLAGKEFDVLYSNYEFSRNTDTKGKPSSNILGGRVEVTFESTEDTSVIEAMLNSQFKPVEGKITYKKTEEDAKMKEIEFKNAYVVYFKETLDVNNEVPMTSRVVFSAEEITVGNAALHNRWPRA
ncbi:type VI secretion system tube protein TssD [Tenacibaculum maritimum]|uniref:Type VI secretion system needle protein Hcp n=1 Tax=Tenacibaculum maritimum NCIMB 2154 TaxID=1349785 RepID=A0A2H1E8L3_9FLAO|nr:type VI secretion system tube protein TssD [Tenacibaculum maritimum]MCD9564166.1 type VI secretion system needle protein Hcp [Tenacibaculum maritimum]MCD9566986.1 type VI secretion system needle protein Hcp [Tenacibaculum maritimum]MCD9580237.1 type VI secretion system needle protein Hcp [Tenacibaculum maritimum]MCD9582897.1 type VI secretion system needle protein Hcp [Tenacibaculum maritimum]MCD9586110.1 type VI secretion system needle protein Hcp [Tenacibaculum maritimum]